MERLRELARNLAEQRASGVISEENFAIERQRLLAVARGQHAKPHSALVKRRLGTVQDSEMRAAYAVVVTTRSHMRKWIVKRCRALSRPWTATELLSELDAFAIPTPVFARPYTPKTYRALLVDLDKWYDSAVERLNSSST